jgi:serine/arginine repetitive matrix protein 1
MPSIKGTSSVEDSRALSKALKATKFPSNFHQTVDITKVNRPVLIQWIERKITECLGFEDEIVQSTAVNLFLPEFSDEGTTVVLDPRKAQIALCGFLGDEQAATFCSQLWDLMLDASTQPAGIPRKLLEEKKKELAAQKLPKSQSTERHPPRQENVAIARGVHLPPPRDDGRPVTRPVSPIQHSSRHSREHHHNSRSDSDRREHRHQRTHEQSSQPQFSGVVDSGRMSTAPRVHASSRTNGEYDEYGRYRGSSWRDDQAHERQHPSHNDRPEDRHRRFSPDRRYRRDERHGSRSRYRNEDDRVDDDRYDGRRRREPRRQRSRSPPSSSRRSRRDRSYSSSSSSSTSSSSSSSSSASRSNRRGRGGR